MAPKNDELIYDMVSKNPSRHAQNAWFKVFDAAKKDQDKILRMAKKK